VTPNLGSGSVTGGMARAAHGRVGAHGHVAGVDPNDCMLTIARGAGPNIDWQTGLAGRLPYPDHSFDRIVSQFALMYFTDPEGALSEVSRVKRRSRVQCEEPDRCSTPIGVMGSRG
jgi:ubiquinone/menaquinone biosynthesis C-methylase UbiE